MASRREQVRERMNRDPGQTLLTAALVTLVGLATRRAVVSTWRAVNGEDPPRDPSRPDVAWPTALGWTTAVGVTVGLARLLTRRALHRKHG